jgi:hypothetical protein
MYKSTCSVLFGPFWGMIVDREWNNGH